MYVVTFIAMEFLKIAVFSSSPLKNSKTAAFDKSDSFGDFRGVDI
jgi:hypothetical protein